ESSPGGGIHWLYRCSDRRGNTKLAERPAPTEQDPHAREPLIETRGEGGWIIIAPSNGAVHPSGGSYTLLSGALGLMAVITAEEREALWNLARTFDEVPEKPAEDDSSTRRTASSEWPATGVKPGDDFADQVEWGEILKPHNFVEVFTRGAITYWRR